MTKQADLIAYLFEGQPHQLSSTLLSWMDASPRFVTFVETYRDKIRKKIRVARDPESALDVFGELAVACGLLADRRFKIVYEPYSSAKRRGPDFAVTYRVNLTFNVEVARLRMEGGADGAGQSRTEERILRILLNKLGQMQPGMANLLAILTRAEVARSFDLAGLLHDIKTRAEAKDPVFYTASRYTGPADFYRDFLRLSGIVLWSSGAQLWVNKQSRPALDSRVMRLVSSLASEITPPGRTELS